MPGWIKKQKTQINIFVPFKSIGDFSPLPLSWTDSCLSYEQGNIIVWSRKLSVLIGCQKSISVPKTLYLLTCPFLMHLRFILGFPENIFTKAFRRTAKIRASVRKAASPRRCTAIMTRRCVDNRIQRVWKRFACWGMASQRSLMWIRIPLLVPARLTTLETSLQAFGTRYSRQKFGFILAW